MNDTQKSVFATLAYYDLFDFPLTADEIKKYLATPSFLKINGDIKLDTIPAELYSMTNAGRVILYGGFYTLPHREHLVPVRIKNNKIATRKMKLARRAAWLMSCMPYVRAVFASGSLALENTDYESDLDLFIITKAGRIWTARFIINSIFDMLRLKRKPRDKIAPDKICPNHLITDNSLTITNRNVFTARVYSHLVPLYVHNQSILKNFKRENRWIDSYIQNWNFSHKYLLNNSRFMAVTQGAREFVLNNKFGNLVENLCRKYQKHRIERNPITREPNGRIEYSNQCLEFHPNSIEHSIIVNYMAKLKSIFNTELTN